MLFSVISMSMTLLPTLWINIQISLPLSKILLNLLRVFRTKKIHCIVWNLCNFANPNTFMPSHNFLPESRNLAFPFIPCNIFLSPIKLTHFPLDFEPKRLSFLSADPLIWFLSVSFMGVFWCLLPDTSFWLLTLSPSTARNLFCHLFWNIYSLTILSRSSLFL